MIWTVKTPTDSIKTFSIEKVYNFIVNSESKPVKFYINYLEIDKGDFLKRFMQISGSWQKYNDLEKLLIEEKSKQLWPKIIKPLKR